MSVAALSMDSKRAVEKSLPTSPTHTDLKETIASSSKAEQKAEADESPPDGIIDMETFYQILDLDEDDTREFSAGMAWAYFDQAGSTFIEMEEALAAKDLAKLSSLGHFLKGSSAALGVAKVQASCERIQHYGQRRDEEAGVSISDGEALDRIESLLAQVKKEYEDAEKWLKEWYRQHGVEPDE